ncbi:unnamed protein product [Paramecium octaurelia]|uniref:Uncharacterized protein n=1 Tax=Paramecium octaurelia TaxID=43137 RepID=A0A8S1VSU9_PAROT|nr:unnamed protein product [Paramecium octaurelia]
MNRGFSFQQSEFANCTKGFSLQLFECGGMNILGEKSWFITQNKNFYSFINQNKTKNYNFFICYKIFKNLNLIIKQMGRAVFHLIKINTHTEYQPQIQGIIIFY